MTTDWETTLRKTAAAHNRAKTALKRARDNLDQAMVNASEQGASLRDIKAITGLNHETIRTVITRAQADTPERPTV